MSELFHFSLFSHIFLKSGLPLFRRFDAISMNKLTCKKTLDLVFLCFL